MFFFAGDFEFVIFMFLDKLLTFYQLHHRLVHITSLVQRWF